MESWVFDQSALDCMYHAACFFCASCFASCFVTCFASALEEGEVLSIYVYTHSMVVVTFGLSDEISSSVNLVDINLLARF